MPMLDKRFQFLLIFQGICIKIYTYGGLRDQSICKMYLASQFVQFFPIYARKCQHHKELNIKLHFQRQEYRVPEQQHLCKQGY